MNHNQVRQILTQLETGTLTVQNAENEILALFRRAPFEDIGFARVDHHRQARQGFPEVIYGAGKSPDQIAAIAKRIVDHGDTLIVTRTDEHAFNAVQKTVPDAQFDATARIIFRRPNSNVTGHGIIAIAAAGTSDIPVAEEARFTAQSLGNKVDAIYDIGIAGLHRLLDSKERLDEARVIITVAGMEGALPSVIGGLVAAPVIAVPTSVGYGTNFGGVTALLGMLNSCASGLAVVNIDNGFGAAVMASTINHLK